MIDLKKECCGCEACMNCCPTQCIQMIEDQEGFLYPKVDIKGCSNCGGCKRACPILNPKMMGTSPKAFAAYHKDSDIRRKSTSGGAFTALANIVLEEQGVVYGAAFNEAFEVIHMGIENKEELARLRGSKYVQSRVGQHYQLIEEKLELDQTVLFSGTPCQVAGLKTYLGREFPKLYCIDLFCKGVPTPKLWRKYLKDQEIKAESKIQSIYFREKTYGFRSTTMSIEFDNGRTYRKGHESDAMLSAFVKELCSRPSCYNCSFKANNRMSDVTLADCWSADRLVPEIDDNLGTTLLLINTEKGQNLLGRASFELILHGVNFEKAVELNGKMYFESQKPNPKRDTFLRDLGQMSIEELRRRYDPITNFAILKSRVKPVFYRLGLLELLKRLKRGKHV